MSFYAKNIKIKMKKGNTNSILSNNSIISTSSPLKIGFDSNKHHQSKRSESQNQTIISMTFQHIISIFS